MGCDTKRVLNELLELSDQMLKELYYAKVNQMVYDIFDVALQKIKDQIEEIEG